MAVKKITFEPVLLDEGIEPKDCPVCGGWMSSPSISQTKESTILKWRCWACKVEFVQVYLK